MRKLTTRQREVLEILEKYVAINHYPPSYRELGALVGLASSSTISGILNKLRENGYVSWEDGRPRTLKVIKTAS
ncbi:transcriptional regulator [Cytobacillus kochii]|uniref:LexA family protein n=1 Tax=Cytobacillus kochii TaxID=859143 RepID=UPI002E1C7007|nr:transcriptional regulator [Cytobacillus kochii]